jgi:hypothetical protein
MGFHARAYLREGPGTETRARRVENAIQINPKHLRGKAATGRRNLFELSFAPQLVRPALLGHFHCNASVIISSGRLYASS